MENKKRVGTFTSLYDTLKEVVDEDKLNQKQIELEAVKLYNSMELDKITEISKAVDLIKGELIVIVKDSSAGQFIQFQSMKIIKAINDVLGRNIVKRIKFRVGKTENNEKNYDKNSNENTKVNLDKVELEEDEKREIEQIVNKIQDNGVKEIIELKKKLLKLFESNLKYKKLESMKK